MMRTRDTKNPGARGPRDLKSCGAAIDNYPLSGILRQLNAFSHPDFTVGPGVSPDHVCVLSRPLAGYTAGQDLTVITRRPHQSPKAMLVQW